VSAELFHAGLGWPIAATLLSFSFLGSFITAAFGIGGGAVLIAVLATLLPASAIIPVHGLVQLGSNIGRAALMFQHIHRAVVLPFFVGSFVGVSLGSAFVVQLDAGMIQIGVGVFILWSILMKPPAIMRHSAGVSGAISSFLTMFFGATGPFIAAFLKTQKLERLGHTATHATLMSIQHALKTVAFGFLGFAFSVWAGLITLLVLSGFLGTIAGRYVLMRINENVFRFTLNLLLAILALRLIYYGSIAFLGG
jgi:uncharacterized membrane protein YfcA